MTSKNREPLTRLLHAWKQGDQDALDEMMPLVYQQLRGMAVNRLRGERNDHSLDPTDLVHEAFARVLQSESEISDRVHFFALLAGLMRRVLVDHARARNAAKRGDGAIKITLSGEVLGEDAPVHMLELDDALRRFAEFDERGANAVELHYFGGFSHEEVAQALGVSKATATRELRAARAWLAKELSG